MICLSREDSDEYETLSMFSVFREYPERCRLIMKSDILKESINGILFSAHQSLCLELFDVLGGGNINISTHPSPHGTFKVCFDDSKEFLF